MAWRELTDQQWDCIAVCLPEPKPRPKGGRPPADDRRCFEGNLWILWTGAPWSELPKRYGSPTTCSRRHQHWEKSGTLLAGLSQMAGSWYHGLDSGGSVYPRERRGATVFPPRWPSDWALMAREAAGPRGTER
jgi:hypothetical protein